MVYCIRSDCTGIFMLPVVYLIMILGNAAFIIIIVCPSLNQYVRSIDDPDSNHKFPVGTIIEWFFYELFSFMMIWSHSKTMCS